MLALRRFSLGIALLATLGTVRSLDAQDWQMIAQSRQVRGEEDLRVSVRFVSGYVSIRPSTPGVLYQTRMRYDADHFDPMVRYDASSRRLRVSLSADDVEADFDVDRNSPQRLDLALAPNVPLRLGLELGATASDVELGGVALRRAEIRTGASDAVISFGSANPIACDHLDIAVGAAQLEIEQLGNARCEHMEIAGGVGDLTIDLTGDWLDVTRRLEVKVGLGEVTLLLPRRLGVRVDLDRLLAGFDESGFVKRGSYYVSDAYDRAPSKLDISIDAIFGDVNIQWVDEQER